MAESASTHFDVDSEEALSNLLAGHPTLVHLDR